MTLQAVWERPEEIPLKITGFLFYDKNDINVDGQNPEPVRIVFGEEITLADCPFSKDGHVFSGWLDSDGRIYKAGGSYLPSSLNVTLVPVWAKDNEAIVTHKVRYESGTDGAEGELPAAFELYEKTSFIVAANTQAKEGWYFLTGRTERATNTVPVTFACLRATKRCSPRYGMKAAKSLP